MVELSCEGCDAQCCKYVSLEIDTPEDLEDFENIKWYVCHKNVQVYVGEDKKWYLEFSTPCRYLDKNNKCSIYDKRPQICRDYSANDCTFHNKYVELFRFEKIEDVEEYIKDVFKKGLHIIPED